jgi:demethylmenaquinone methyltransferase/2-methoxy-6-polyprenyl-1,4-benzoquinol methylase
VGGIISGDSEAYKYLPRSVEEFDEKIDIAALLSSSGFGKITKHNFTFGIVQVVIAEK